jgi:hypothetical protein
MRSCMVCQVLALINASNNSCSPAIIDYTEFYNTALDHTDLMKVLLYSTFARKGLSHAFWPSTIDHVDLMIKNQTSRLTYSPCSFCKSLLRKRFCALCVLCLGDYNKLPFF